ncbi:hypothetical protein [Deinococcus radiodurans]|nr:hypothetical protein [Deinococcus radiodurans]UID72095.1 hypothetical protein DRO_C0020 [Deinococcus radiodurans R1 = ATCC 13939 = DSM 20539]UTA52577.1 hypothetical protein MSS93_17535 [Deinococcus radiodurans]
MPIWSRYRYRVEDYWPLILVLRQSNKYTHGVLVPLTSAQRADPKRRRTKGEKASEESRWLTSVELEERALDRYVEDLSLVGKSEEELAEYRRQNFQFYPDPESPDVLAHREEGPKQVKGSRVIPVPEGWVILGRKAKYRGLPELQDLRCAPSIRLVPFIIRWRPEFSDQKLGRAEARPGRADQTLEEGRLSLQVNRDFVRLKIKIIREMTGRKHFYESSPGGTIAAWKKEAELIKGVNQVTKELIALKRWAFVEPDTYSAYDSEVRKRVKIWLTSVRHRKAEQAQALVFKYVVPWRYNPGKLPSKLALAHREALRAAEGRDRGRKMKETL